MKAECAYESTVYLCMCVCMFMCTPQNIFVNNGYSNDVDTV